MNATLRVSSRTKPCIYKVGLRWAVQCHPNRRTTLPSWQAAVTFALRVVAARKKSELNPVTKEGRERLLFGPKIFFPLKRRA